jgi:hypothetical protein
VDQRRFRSPAGYDGSTHTGVDGVAATPMGDDGRAIGGHALIGTGSPG